MIYFCYYSVLLSIHSIFDQIYETNISPFWSAIQIFNHYHFAISMVHSSPTDDANKKTKHHKDAFASKCWQTEDSCELQFTTHTDAHK